MRFKPQNWRRKEARSFLPFLDREVLSLRVDKIFKNIARLVSSTRSSSRTVQGVYDIFRIYLESIFSLRRDVLIRKVIIQISSLNHESNFVYPS